MEIAENQYIVRSESRSGSRSGFGSESRSTYESDSRSGFEFVSEYESRSASERGNSNARECVHGAIGWPLDCNRVCDRVGLTG